LQIALTPSDVQLVDSKNTSAQLMGKMCNLLVTLESKEKKKPPKEKTLEKSSRTG